MLRKSITLNFAETWEVFTGDLTIIFKENDVSIIKI